MKVLDWISQHPNTVMTAHPEIRLKELVDQLISESQSTRDIYIVSDDGELLGHLPSRNVLRLYMLEHQPVHTRRQIMERVTESTAEELMERHFPTAQPDEDLDSVLHRQIDHDMVEMAVIDDEGRLAGVIDLFSVVRTLRNFERTEGANTQSSE